MTITEAAIAASCLTALGTDEKAAHALRAMAEKRLGDANSRRSKAELAAYLEL